MSLYQTLSVNSPVYSDSAPFDSGRADEPIKVYMKGKIEQSSFSDSY